MKAEFTARTITNARIYKDFYRFYYKITWKRIRIAGTAIGSVLVFFALAFIFTQSLIPGIVCAWIGIVLIIYPRNAYRRQAREEKGNSYEMRFRFGEDIMEESYHGNKTSYGYDEIKAVYAGGKYVYVFTSDSQAAVLLREDIKGGTADELLEFLRGKIGKDKVKRIK